MQIDCITWLLICVVKSYYMPSKYQELQREKTINLINSLHPVFAGAEAGKRFLGKDRDFVLKEAEKNLYPSIMTTAVYYFRQNRISWWGGKDVTGHTLSSQVACINHLFAIRNDLEAVTLLIKGLNPDFIRPLLIGSDKYSPGYIQFESVSDKQYLNEDGLTRGTQCTSVDALIYAEHKDGSLWLIPIEWKFTEHYSNRNKALEGAAADPTGCKGSVRQSRYNNLIRSSNQLKYDNLSLFYFEPFYQLMRQTLWAEQMVKNKDNETLKADNFLHVHVIPKDNNDLLKETGKPYKCSGLSMEGTWRSLLKDQSKYQIIDPKDLMRPLSSIPAYAGLLQYLAERY